MAKLEPVLTSIETIFPDKYVEEINGIHQVISDAGYGDRLSQGELAIINLMYELTVYCTSVVSKTPTGEIIHGRNLDYGITGLQNLTATIHFTDADENTVFSSTAFIGYVGVLTGMSKHFSVSVDQRGPNDDNSKFQTIEGILENLVSAATGGSSVGMFLRSQLESTTSFEEVVTTLSAEKMIAPVYLIVGGLAGNEGAIITRDRLHPDEEVKEGVWRITDDNYWRLETNYDHWKAVPEDDDRRDPANACMEAMGVDGVSVDSVRDCLSEQPVLNWGTVYTTLMSAQTAYFDTLVRDPTNVEK